MIICIIKGAVSSFLGITRQDSTVAKLEYSCHLQMAEKQIIEIIEQGVFKEYPSVTHVSIAHKIGESTLGKHLEKKGSISHN